MPGAGEFLPGRLGIAGRMDLASLAKRVPRWVTTEKDALKIVPWWAGDAEILVLRIQLAVEPAEETLEWLAGRGEGA